MAKKGRRYKGLNIAIILVLIILLITVGLNVFIYLENEKLSKEYNNLTNDYSSKEEMAKKESNEKIEYENKIKELENVDNSIEIAKQDYYTNIKKLEDKILAGESKQKIAYITFDDGPYANTENVLSVLKKYDIRATFFTTNINGQYCYDNKKVDCWTRYKMYLQDGHTIANHTYTHGIWRGLYSSADSFIQAVKDQENLIKEKTGGYITRIVRFPGGSSTAGKLKQPIINKLKEMGYGWVDWSAQDGDGGELNSTTEAWSNFKSSINSNIEVVLFHDYSTITLSILPDVIEYLKSNGYILLPLFYESNMINK